MLPLTGYADRFSVAPGEAIAFKVSCSLEQAYSARLVRVICGDPNPAGPGLREADLADVFRGAYPSRVQPVHLGSYARVARRCLRDVDSATLVATVWPTTPGKGRQGIAGSFDTRSATGFSLVIDAHGSAGAVIGDGVRTHEIAVGKPLRERTWYRLWACYDARSGVLRVGQLPLTRMFGIDDRGVAETHVGFAPRLDSPAVWLAALGASPACDHFNGKLERPLIVGEALDEDAALLAAADATPPAVVALWDFSRDISSQRVVDVGPSGYHGELVNVPARGMTGSRWRGDEMCWRHAPADYAAIHFHDDDLYDCRWETDFSFTVPADLASGVYAMRLECAGVSEMIPFFVRPPAGGSRADICVLAPTFTYTVYGNHARNNTDDSYRAKAAAWGARPWTPDDHPDYGLSTYNFHNDGSGICFASRLRPMITTRSGYVTFAEDFAGSGLRHFAADTHLYYWLERKGHAFDVVTDEDLHEHGLALIEPYKVVLTTSHPEYHTRETLDALEGYLEGGGRLMYLGGNGFYWRVAVHPELPGMVEIRRGEGGIRAWAAEPGEYYNSLDGCYGGLWRRNGRPPQRLAGVGFSGQGKFEGSYYRRAQGADDPRAAWIFEGVDDDILGDFGLCGGGAAGFELDRRDPALGSPPHALVLATSERHADHYVLVPEEHLTHLYNWPREPEQALIRADMVYFETPNGGAVFSAGSITFCGSLPHNDCDNNISRIVDNVLRRFSR